MTEIADWFRSLPVFTRYWFGLSVLFPILGRFRLVNPQHLVLSYDHFVRGFQIWRPVTSVFFYPMGFHYLVNLYFLYSYSIRLETGLFDGHPANYLFMLLFNWICIVIVALLSDLMLLMDPMVLSVLYVWCQFNKDVIVSFWFGTQFKAIYLPWVLLAFNMIISGGGLYELIGILVGHLYFFLMFKYPQEFGGRNLLRVPSILYRYFPDRVGGVSGFGQAPVPRRPADAGGNGAAGGGGGGGSWHNWGQGRVLGN